MKKIITIFFLFFVSNCFGQQITFQKIYGIGTSYNYGVFVQQTSDSGYIMTGRTMIIGSGLFHIYLIKTNSFGDTLWTKTFGGGNGEFGNGVRQTTDGGYIIIGSTASFGTNTDIYLIKTDSSGDTLWTKTYGGTAGDVGYSVQQTKDGGYILVGNTSSFGLPNGSDIYVIKTDTNGDTLWSKTFGDDGNGYVDGSYVLQTTDSGYIVAGDKYNGGNDYDLFLIKLNVNGDTLWTRSIGGPDQEIGNSVQQTTDGGFIVAGTTENMNTGNYNIYIVKTDSIGNIIWSRTYDGINNEGAWSVQQTADGGYFVSGRANFQTANEDAYLMKTDSNGIIQWSKTYGGTTADGGYFGQLTNDGGYVIIGYTYSFGGDDFYLIKTDSLGNSGCNEANTSFNLTSSSTQDTATTTIVISPPTIVTTAAFLIGSGGNVTTLCTTVGISPTPTLPEVEGVVIAPNPTTGNFVITFPNTINKGVIEIYNVLGKKIFESTIFNSSQKEIRLKNINAGIYFVKVRDGEKEYTQKLVVQ